MKKFVRGILIGVCILSGYSLVEASGQVYTIDACYRPKETIKAEIIKDTFDAFRKADSSSIVEKDPIGKIPNPTTNQTLLRWDANIDRIEVISETGQRVLTYNVTGLQQKIVDMSTLSTGIYFVRFLVDNSIVATKKLIKQ